MEGHKKLSAYEVELQVPYYICAEVQTENHLWEVKGGDW